MLYWFLPPLSSPCLQYSVSAPPLGLWSSAASVQHPKTHSQRHRDVLLNGSQPYHFVGSLTTLCCSLHGWEAEIAFLVKNQRLKTGPTVLCSKPYFSTNLSIQQKVKSLHMVKAIWSVTPISIPAYLKVLVVKLIWLWNFLWKWTRIPSPPVNVHLAKPYPWFWVLLLPGHVQRLRCVLSFSCVQTLWDSTDTTTLHVG